MSFEEEGDVFRRVVALVVSIRAVERSKFSVSFMFSGQNVVIIYRFSDINDASIKESPRKLEIRKEMIKKEKYGLTILTKCIHDLNNI